MSLIANLIRENPATWRRILTEKEIDIHEEGHLMSFNYRITADFFDPVVREARGIILDMRDLHVVCYPFNKFSNHMEPYADSIDWSSARVQEKIDGSIMKLYWFEGEWKIATNASVNAYNAPAGNSGKTFGELFREAAKLQALDLNVLDKSRTYIFELTSPQTKVLIDYGPVPQIWHIGTRDNVTEKELEEDIGIRKPEEYPLNNFEACIEAARKMNNEKELVEKEGFVIVDKDYHRIKIKSPEYIIVHSVLPNGTVSNLYLLKRIRNGEIDDILAYRPDLYERAQFLKEGIKDVERRILAFSEYFKKKVSKEGTTRKEFAGIWRKTPYFPHAADMIFEDSDINIEPMRTKTLFELIQNRPVLNIAVGIPGSGKSTYDGLKKCVHISSDEIREELLGDVNDQTQNGVVFAEFHKRIREALLSGRSVYADATNISARDRKFYKEAMKIAYKTKAVVFATPLEECIRRDAERERTVGTDVIEKMVRRFEIPFTEEGFDEIEIIRTENLKVMDKEMVTNILDRMDGFDQTSVWHTEDLKTHSVNAWRYFSEKHDSSADKAAALLHDYGKLFTRTYDEKGAHFYNHGSVGAYILISEFTFSGITESDVRQILFLVCYHDKAINMKKEKMIQLFGKNKAKYLMDFRDADVKAAVRGEL